MTPVMRVLRVIFFQPAGDRERCLAETERRVDHADRMLNNASIRLAASTERLRQEKEEMVNREMVDMIRSLSTTLDRK